MCSDAHSITLSECIAETLQMTLLYQHITNTLTKLLQPSLMNYNKWWENNHMAINISRTKLNMCVTLNPTHRQLPNTHSLPSVQLLDYCVIDECSSERFLGVTINNDLSWNTHVENVINQCDTLSRIKVQVYMIRITVTPSYPTHF